MGQSKYVRLILLSLVLSILGCASDPNRSPMENCQSSANLQHSLCVLGCNGFDTFCKPSCEMSYQTQSGNCSSLSSVRPPINSAQSNSIDQRNVPRILPTPPGAFQSALPICTGNGPSNWNNCVGTVIYPNGNKYVGEFKNGQREGQGEIRIVATGVSRPGYIAAPEPSTYVGAFKNNMLNGYGTLTTDRGISFSGEFTDNVLVRKY